jgi:tol-pal system protein YbgF
MAVALLVFAPQQANAQIYNSNPSAAGGNNEIRIQQMETQIRELTGRVEEQNYEIDQLKEKLMDLQNAQIKAQANTPAVGASQIGVPTRQPQSTNNSPLNFEPPAIAGMQTATPKSTTTLPTEATAQYEAAFASLKARDYDVAQKGFEDFLKDHKKHLLTANAKYWLGETYYVRGNYKTAAKTFAEGFQTYPESAKAPDMLLKLGLALEGMGKTSDACVALSQVSVKFPLAGDDLINRASSEMSKLNCDT